MDQESDRVKDGDGPGVPALVYVVCHEGCKYTTGPALSPVEGDGGYTWDVAAFAYEADAERAVEEYWPGGAVEKWALVPIRKQEEVLDHRALSLRVGLLAIHNLHRTVGAAIPTSAEERILAAKDAVSSVYDEREKTTAEAVKETLRFKLAGCGVDGVVFDAIWDCNVAPLLAGEWAVIK